jgi:hypothetical protein
MNHGQKGCRRASSSCGRSWRLPGAAKQGQMKLCMTPWRAVTLQRWLELHCRRKWIAPNVWLSASVAPTRGRLLLLWSTRPRWWKIPDLLPAWNDRLPSGCYHIQGQVMDRTWTWQWSAVILLMDQVSWYQVGLGSFSSAIRLPVVWWTGWMFGVRSSVELGLPEIGIFWLCQCSVIGQSLVHVSCKYCSLMTWNWNAKFWMLIIPNAWSGFGLHC